MSVIDEVLQNNQKYADQFTQGHLPMPPARKLAVLACMDARLTVEQFLGLKTGDAHIIRNAGGIASEDALRSLIISHHLLGTEEFIIVNHTDCGMLTFKDHELLGRLEKQSGTAFVAPVHFHAFLTSRKMCGGKSSA
jgi:carbonic anhydrase